MPRLLDPDTAPIVGRYYLVPCIQVLRQHRYGNRWIPRDGWVPVIGQAHADPELGVKERHYHVDWRFLTASQRRQTRGPAVGTVITSANGIMSLSATELRKRRCNAPAPEYLKATFSQPFQELEKAHRGACLKPGHICPHRGIALGGFASPDGTVNCPGHGLKWDLLTGKNLHHHCPQ